MSEYYTLVQEGLDQWINSPNNGGECCQTSRETVDELNRLIKQIKRLEELVQHLADWCDGKREDKTVNHLPDANKMVSDTPRTDAEAFYPHDSNKKVCDADFARQLERELNAAINQFQRLEKAGDAMAIYAQLGGIPLQFVGVVNAWRVAKEAKP